MSKASVTTKIRAALETAPSSPSASVDESEMEDIVAEARKNGVSNGEIKAIAEAVSSLTVYERKSGHGIRIPAIPAPPNSMSKDAAAVADKFFVEFDVPAGANKDPMVARILASMPSPMPAPMRRAPNTKELVSVTLQATPMASSTAYVDAQKGKFYVQQSAMCRPPKFYGPFDLAKAEVRELTSAELDAMRRFGMAGVGLKGHGQLTGTLGVDGDSVVLWFAKHTRSAVGFELDLDANAARQYIAAAGTRATLEGLIEKVNPGQGKITNAAFGPGLK